MDPRPPNPAWAELLQLVPVITLASSFLVAGEVDLARAGPLFALAALLTVPITLGVLARGAVPNPILLGTAAWLWLGAAAFGIPLPPLADAIAAAPATGLFSCALLVGLAATFTGTGYVGTRYPDPAWIRRASFGLLALTALVIAWSFVFRADLRIGNGLPFVVLNVARRVLIVRGTR